MLIKTNENKGLFMAIVDAYNKQKDPSDPALNYFICKEISNEQLAKITKMNLSYAFCGQEITSLEGIDQLVNLQELKLDGATMSEAQFYGPRSLGAIFGKPTPEEIAQQNGAIKSYYERNQITDISPLYGCKNLKKLSLNNQRSIREIDVSQFPKLQHLNMNNCKKLRVVKGLSNLEIFTTNKQDCYKAKFSFNSCDSLNSIQNFPAVLNACKDEIGTGNPIFNLPATTYIYLCQNNPIFDKKINDIERENGINIVNWTVVNAGNVVKNHNSQEMSETRKKLQEIITQENLNVGKNDLEKIANVYSWISKNVTYDRENEKNIRRLAEMYQTADNKKAIGATFNRVASDITSPVEVVKQKNGVCAGISNLFNCLLIEMGMEAVPVDVHTPDEDNPDYVPEERAQPTHQIGKVYIKNGKQVQALYFDPTNDLQSDINKRPGYDFKLFGLTKEEMENNLGQPHYVFDENGKPMYDSNGNVIVGEVSKMSFTLDYADEPNGESIQEELKEQGLLDSRRTPQAEEEITDDLV